MLIIYRANVNVAKVRLRSTLPPAIDNLPQSRPLPILRNLKGNLISKANRLIATNFLIRSIIRIDVMKMRFCAAEVRIPAFLRLSPVGSSQYASQNEDMVIVPGRVYDHV